MVSIPVTDLKNTSAVTEACLGADEPVLVTKNGRVAFWLVRPDEMERLREAAERERLHERALHSERQWREGRATDAAEGIAKMRARHGL